MTKSARWGGCQLLVPSAVMSQSSLGDEIPRKEIFDMEFFLDDLPVFKQIEGSSEYLKVNRGTLKFSKVFLSKHHSRAMPN